MTSIQANGHVGVPTTGLTTRRLFGLVAAAVVAALALCACSRTSAGPTVSVPDSSSSSALPTGSQGPIAGFGASDLCAPGLVSATNAALKGAVALRQRTDATLDCRTDTLLTIPSEQFVVAYLGKIDSAGASAFSVGVGDLSSEGGNAAEFAMFARFPAKYVRVPDVDGLAAYWDSAARWLFVAVGNDWSVQINDTSDGSLGNGRAFTIGASAELQSFIAVANVVYPTAFG